MKKKEMEEESHLNPLAPPAKYPKSDRGFVASKPSNTPHKNHQERSSKCLVYVLLLVVLLSMAFLILGLVVLRIRTPSLRLSNVVVEVIRYKYNSSSSSLNATVVAEVRLHNMNFGRFKFGGGNTTLLYENATIGAARIRDGSVSRREAREFNVTVKVMGYNHELSENFGPDISMGLVKIWGFAELRGEVRVVKIINQHRTAVMNCSMTLNLTSQAIQDLSCH